MSRELLDTDTWNQRIDSYVAATNAIAGRTGPAPLFTEGPLAFPMKRTHIDNDLIGNFARAIGDTNPLWNDTHYAASSGWGTVISPPILEACLAEGASNPPPPPITGWDVMHGGGRRRYYQPLRPGDVIRAEDVWHGLREKTRPSRPYRLFVAESERRYLNRHDRMVASLIGRSIVIATPPEATGAPSGPDLSNRQPRRYTSGELAAIRAGYERELSGEARRGRRPRYWEDVHENDVVPEIFKGPYDVCDATSFAGALGVCGAFATKWKDMASEADTIDPRTGAPQHPLAWHFDDRLARLRGFPHGTAFGIHLETMLLHPVTNWMSDDAFLTDADIQIRSVLLIGEVSRTTGSVVGKRVDGRRHLVELAMLSRTLDGVPYATARVVVDLPSHNGYSPAVELS
jgi:acyl dehydratase